MDREDILEKGTNEAYALLADSVLEYVTDYVHSSIFEYEYFDFTDEIFDFINEEKKADPDSDVVYEIMEPALKKIMKVVREALG